MKRFMSRICKPLREEERRPLIKCNSLPKNGDNLTQNMEGGNSDMENSLSINQEVQIRPCVLAEALRVCHVVPAEGPEAEVDGQPREMMCCEAQKDNTQPKILLQTYLRLIEVSVDKHFPNVPTEGAVNQLECYLKEIQRTVLRELLRLAPLHQETQLLRNVIACYHRYTFDTLRRILLHINTKQQAFTVVDWVLHTYLSKELLGHPDLWNESIQAVDLLLLTDWISQAEGKLLAIVQEDLFTSLGRILKIEESSAQVCVSVDEAFVHVHLDVIQCVNAVLQRAKTVSQTLKLKVQRVCWREFKDFVERYVGVKKKHLKDKSRMGKSCTMHLFRITNTCEELTLYASVIAVDNKTILALEELDALTLKLLMESLIQSAQKTLAKCFGRLDEQMENVIKDIEIHFKDLPKHQETLKTVIDEAYRHIVSLYLQHLVRSDYNKLLKRWDDIGKQVARDAELLHTFFSGLNPDVKRLNLILLKVAEAINCSDVETLKIIVGVILRDCSSIGTEHLPALLRWKGLSRRKIHEVLEASQEVYPIDLSALRYCCLSCR
ncbi:hypothetical protein DPEC_G00293510 [Dallia pectoralis]|uniref:Uncharacterized protein n=1 Tax=Dallia pectoralis TaxID=75939 RepID=A0ACC2FIC5_DALPE|nr:hypothetical protein DPEC_G00293510 [Dallia pectoralis]